MIMFKKKEQYRTEDWVKTGYSITYRKKYEVGCLKERVSMLKELGCIDIEITVDGCILCKIPI